MSNQQTVLPPVTDEEALKKIIEWIHFRLSNSTLAGTEIDAIWTVTGRACGKVHSSDQADWSHIQEAYNLLVTSAGTN